MVGDCNIRLLSELRDACATTKSKWAHEVRKVVGRAVWKGIEKEKTRGEGTWGIKDGIDQGMTMKLYHKSDNKKKGTIRKILVGRHMGPGRDLHIYQTCLVRRNALVGWGRETLMPLWAGRNALDGPYAKKNSRSNAAPRTPSNLTIATRELGNLPC